MTEQTELESEREFLLRSLDDLEAEREAGNIDDETYRSLHDDYTARAATVIRSLQDGVALVLPEPPPSSRRMKIVTVVALVAFTAFAAYGLSRALGTRDEGQTITGNAQSDDPGNDIGLTELRRAAADRPDDYDARIAYARALLGSDLAEALKQFDAASKIDSTKPEPYTYIGWIDALAARQLQPGADRDGLVSRALASFDAALARDPNYYDAYVYRALT
jgi:hypothetical protein